MANWLQQLLADSGFWTESWRRRVFGGVLALIGLATFIEVVLMPGALIRRPVATAATEVARAESTDQRMGYPDVHPTVQLIESLLESAETKRAKAEAREAAVRNTLKNRLLEAQAELIDARAMAAKEWQLLVGEVQRRHQVKLDAIPFDTRSQPRELNQMILSSRTAATAWTAIRNLASQANTDFQSIDTGIRDLNRRLERDGFAESDGRRQQALLTAVQTIRGRIKQAYRDLDHINVQVRAKSFLVHNSTERREQ